MKNLFLCGVCLLLFTSAAESNAQSSHMRFNVGGPNVLNVSLEPSRFSRETALKTAPSGAISEKSGLIRGIMMRAGRSTPATLLVHFYALPVQHKRRVGGFDLWFDCFITARRAPTKWERLNRLNLTQRWPGLYGNWALGQDKIRRVELLWIDGKAKKIAAISTKMSTDSISGWYGCYGMLSFPAGLKGAVSAQSFDEESDFTESLGISFSRRKDNGNLTIRSARIKENTGYDREVFPRKFENQTDFYWNGRFFQSKSGDKTNRKLR